MRVKLALYPLFVVVEVKVSCLGSHEAKLALLSGGGQVSIGLVSLVDSRWEGVRSSSH